MTSNALMRAHQLISRAYELPRDARDAFLARESAADPRLRQELAWMVAALRTERGGDDAFLEGAPSFGPMPAQLHAGGDREYRLVRPLGEGGMGAVWLAERSDGEFTQQVALKTLNVTAAMLPDLVARFGEERRILASLAHPNIAHLIDGGTTADGRPYLAIEYVEGEHIDQYCRARSLPLRERVALFLKVCAAVNHAHQHLVIHRDIKPSNILVTPEGEPKLLDFGIARLVDDANAAARTATGLRFMTIAYASPEQVRGDVLGTATDVYSLGMVLYELLAGARPWADDLTQPQLVRAICDDEPVAPSAMHARTTRRRGEIPRDLDAIVLKALRKKPDDRYASVQSLADDLRRFLALQPVSARRGHAAYRAGKWFARHRVTVVWVSLLAIAGIGFLWDRESTLLREAHEARRAREVSELFKTTVVASDVARGERAQTIPALLDRLALAATGNPSMSPDVRAEALADVGTAYLNYGLNDAARPLLFGAWAMRGHRLDRPVAAVDVELSQAIGRALQQPIATVDWHRRAVGIARARFGHEAIITVQAELALARILIGWTNDTAAEIRALTEHAAHVLADAGEAYVRDERRARLLLADLAVLERRFADAARQYGELSTGALTPGPTWLPMAPIRHGEVLMLLGDVDGAARIIDANYAAYAKNEGERHSSTLVPASLAVDVARARGDWRRARETARIVLEIVGTDDAGGSPSIWALQDIALVASELPGGADEARSDAARAERALAANPAMSMSEQLIVAMLRVRASLLVPRATTLRADVDTMMTRASALLTTGGMAAELREAEALAAEAYNVLGDFAATRALGAATRAAGAPAPPLALALLQAEATARAGDGDDALIAAARGIRAAARGACSADALALRRLRSRIAPSLARDEVFNWVDSACAQLPSWSAQPGGDVDRVRGPG